jgi:hypothetical protein
MIPPHDVRWTYQALDLPVLTSVRMVSNPRVFRLLQLRAFIAAAEQDRS